MEYDLKRPSIVKSGRESIEILKSMMSALLWDQVKLTQSPNTWLANSEGATGGGKTEKEYEGDDGEIRPGYFANMTVTATDKVEARGNLTSPF